jgi:hypothetical protein
MAMSNVMEMTREQFLKLTDPQKMEIVKQLNSRGCGKDMFLFQKFCYLMGVKWEDEEEEPLPKLSDRTWDDAPEWARWRAVDKTGVAFYYENKPVIDSDGGWLGGRPFNLLAISKFDHTNWKDSLEERPVKEKKLRPWRPEEAIGKCIRMSDGKILKHIMMVDGDLVWFGGGPITSLDKLLSNYTQPNGEPCGVYE